MSEQEPREHLKELRSGASSRKCSLGAWQTRHKAAVLAVSPGMSARRRLERGMARMLQGWAMYADAHRDAYESGIGEDYVLGPQWEAIGRALDGLLNGELGDLDGGTLSAFLADSLRAEGFKTEG